MTGPFETLREARDTPRVRAIYDAAHLSTRRGVCREGSHRLLCDALAGAGVELGAYDHRIALWLAGWEPETVAAIAGWIDRARGPEPTYGPCGSEHFAAECPNCAGRPSATPLPQVVCLSWDQAETVADALMFAAEYRRYRASMTCEACSEHPAEVCEDHAADLDRADAYDTLAAQLGSPVPALDSEPWTCRDCGAQLIGRRAPDDLCPGCLGFRVSGDGRASAVPRCCRCRTNPVALPGTRRADGYPTDSALYCPACVDRCHEAEDFAHVCVICAGPDELASGTVPGADAAWRDAVRQTVLSQRSPVTGDGVL